MNKNYIKAQITKHIKKSMNSQRPRLGAWYVGITNDAKRRKAEHRIGVLKYKYWKVFNAKTMEEANEIEAYFSKKGTINRPSKNGANESSTCVYIFRKPNDKPMGLNGVFTDKNIIEDLFK